MYIHRTGGNCGGWTDRATGEYGDLLDLINVVICGGQRDMLPAMQWARQWLGNESVPARKAKAKPQDDDDAAAIAAARKVWAAAQPITGTLAATYLRARAITIDPLPVTLRYAPALLHYDTGLLLPALVAAISGPDGKVTAVRRVYLRQDGMGKAAVNAPKMTLGRMRDGACRLAPAGSTLGIAEGIETALSAMELKGVPCWAACGSRLDAISIPDTVEHLMIFRDGGEPGKLAADRARAAHARPGRSIEIRTPPAKDWNEHAQRRARIAAGVH